MFLVYFFSRSTFSGVDDNAHVRSFAAGSEYNLNELGSVCSGVPHVLQKKHNEA